MPAAAPSSGFDGLISGEGIDWSPFARIQGPMMRWLTGILILLLIALQYRLWVGGGSLADLHVLKREIALQEAEIKRLSARNQELQAEVEDLKQGLDAVEERARSELGMIKPGETFIQVIETPKPGIRQ